ncbi:MAG: hypothetical protein NZ888_06360 [Candidatus Nitrosocaldus sp.]|nr:hypothetical protein [Candidatus Nitrosocaldus sp.]MCS7141790.1 hypothetical protein [Candidatus Nitrosocaldus sp.]MDW8000466.1 hypothetical protein [Candidatus Nitrosocaldus sp.]
MSNAVIASLLCSMLLLSFVIPVFAMPSPITFQRSIPYTVFNSTSATVYDVQRPTSAPFEIFINNQLKYNTTGTKAAIVKFQDAKTGSMNALEIAVYNTKAIDVNWTDKATGTTTRIATIPGDAMQDIAREIIIENSGTIMNIMTSDGKDVVKGFVLPAEFKIVAISGYGNDATSQVASDGFVTVYLGGLNPSKSVSFSLNAFMPLIVAVAAVGIILTLVNKIRQKV